MSPNLHFSCQRNISIRKPTQQFNKIRQLFATFRVKVPISPKILHFYMNLGSAMNNLGQKKIRSEAFLYFFYAVKDAKKRHFRLPVLTMTEQGRSIRSLGCDVRGVTCCRVLESYDCWYNASWILSEQSSSLQRASICKSIVRAFLSDWACQPKRYVAVNHKLRMLW